MSEKHTSEGNKFQMATGLSFKPKTDEEHELFANCDFPRINPAVSFEEIADLKNTNILSYVIICATLKRYFVSGVTWYENLQGLDHDHSKNPLTLWMKVDFSRPVNPVLLKNEFSDIVDAFMLAQVVASNPDKKTRGENGDKGEVDSFEREMNREDVTEYIAQKFKGKSIEKHINVVINAVNNIENANFSSDIVKTSDYTNILKAGDMYYEFDGTEYKTRVGVTHESIAKEIFPDDFKNAWDGKGDSKITRVTQLCGMYKKLVSGGWRSIVPKSSRRK
jgi:hypothetical protein